MLAAPFSIDSAWSRSYTNLYFHLQDTDILGDNIKIRITGENGASFELRAVLLPFQQELQRSVQPGYFDIGEEIEACIYNFDVRDENCDTAQINQFGNADFELDVPQNRN
jgi:hypothetical protein